LIENWPFLKETLMERRDLGKEGKDKEKTSKFDMLTASQFPFLRKYISPCKYDESKKEEKWGALKVAMVVNRLDETEPLEDELLSQINNIWKNTSDSNRQSEGGPSL